MWGAWLVDMHATNAILMLVHGTAFNRTCAGLDRGEVTHSMWIRDSCGLTVGSTQSLCLWRSHDVRTKVW